MGGTRPRVPGGSRVDVRLVEGGETRQDSVRTALATVPGSVGVRGRARRRPAVRPARSLHAGRPGRWRGADGAVPVLAVADTVLRVRDEVVEGVESREELGLGQTPQAFRTAALREAHAKAEAAGAAFTDDASMLRWAGFEVRAVPGRSGEHEDHHDGRSRVRRPPDGDGRWLIRRRARLRRAPLRGRSSALARRCPVRRGGRVSPDTPTATSSATRSRTRSSGPWRSATWGSTSPTPTPETEGMTGEDLLGRTIRLLAEGGHTPVSVDVTIVCERPAIAPRRLELRERLARSTGPPGRSRLRQGDPPGGARADRRRHRVPGARGGLVSDAARHRPSGRRRGVASGPGPRGARRDRGA